ncbi:MAG TPA: HlyD family efflux transporter periplasmic adaptor subunit [Polyangiaceae bacterium]|nr:HlyD family efflux transporter periplasmic adaptor subunit [Polyangiaceae bacterium]
MSFEGTARALTAMRLRAHAALIAQTSLLFAAWVAWLVGGRVTLYVASRQGRFEVEGGALQVNAPVSEVVAACDLALGRRVAAGDVLMRLEVRAYELQVAERRAALAARERAAEALRAQLDAEHEARLVLAELVARTDRAGRARSAASRKDSDLKEQENEIVARLTQAELASKLEALKALSEAEALRLRTAVAAEQAQLDTAAARAALRDRDVRIASLQKQTVEAESELAVEKARLEALEYEVERRVVRAPVAGTLTDVVPCTPGMGVTSTQRLGTLLPEGRVRLVAYFEPRDAIGRVRPGQRAIVRVESFPWTQFGTLEATVAEVGAEPRDGLVRAELRLPPPGGPIPALHGLVATAEVETERLSPAVLLLRMAGQPWSAGAPRAGR